MTRVKRGVTSRFRHKKLVRLAKGFRGRRKNVYRIAKQAVMKSQQYSYIGRKRKKRTYRSLWVIHINIASRKYGLNYSTLMKQLRLNGIVLNRKQLSDLIEYDSSIFKAIVGSITYSTWDNNSNRNYSRNTINT
ncbi:50S ribosomal protein L20 [Candidatus Tremblaya phenacola]|uniref:Large ribosomal subunit protein bL20 n=1 Tax=Candidatus Tremblayella phenacoccinincola TaxID=1010676 RepID=A0A2G0V787_9PROT|nr:50S ribosomal protein L20 [Candidatus Tremblaya phenacola]PHN16313.1 50S ribosomal protein L20 [Candidatus Tremblaya phenacola]